MRGKSKVELKPEDCAAILSDLYKDQTKPQKSKYGNPPAACIGANIAKWRVNRFPELTSDQIVVLLKAKFTIGFSKKDLDDMRVELRERNREKFLIDKERRQIHSESV